MDTTDQHIHKNIPEIKRYQTVMHQEENFGWSHTPNNHDLLSHNDLKEINGAKTAEKYAWVCCTPVAGDQQHVFVVPE